MENWHIYEGFLGATAEIPDGWSTPDSIAAAIGIDDPLVEKESSLVQNGTFAAKLTTTELDVLGTPLTVPGTLTTGKIGFDFTDFTPTITGGAAITDEPEALEGYFRYEPSGTDTMSVIVYIKAGDDTVGTGVYRNSDNVTAYQMFSAPITYSMTGAADSLIIIITSSGSFTSLSEGSTLYVDNMSLTGGVYVDGWASLGIRPNIYPNPASGFINIINPVKDDVVMEVYNLQGQHVAALILKPETNTIDLTNFATGIYSFRLMEDGTQVYSSKFKVAK
jgi:hypothetical protein